MHESYVYNIYQWVINDVITKVREDVVRGGTDEAMLHELAAEWEKQVLKTKAFEVPHSFSHEHNSADSLLLRKHQNIKNDACNNQRMRAQLEQQLRQYQNATYMLSTHYAELSTEQTDARQFYYFLFHQYAAAIENLEAQIHYISHSEIIPTVSNNTRLITQDLNGSLFREGCGDNRAIFPNKKWNTEQNSADLSLEKGGGLSALLSQREKKKQRIITEQLPGMVMCCHFQAYRCLSL
jgi:hypothetical protein